MNRVTNASAEGLSKPTLNLKSSDGKDGGQFPYNHRQDSVGLHASPTPHCSAAEAAAASNLAYKAGRRFLGLILLSFGSMLIIGCQRSSDSAAAASESSQTEGQDTMGNTDTSFDGMEMDQTMPGSDTEAGMGEGNIMPSEPDHHMDSGEDMRGSDYGSGEMMQDETAQDGY